MQVAPVSSVYHLTSGRDDFLSPYRPCDHSKIIFSGTSSFWYPYPDRCKGGVFGCHEETPHIEPTLVPQECGLHLETQQVVLQLRGGQTLTLEQTGTPFAFSALPNTAQEIEAAQHLSELPDTGRTCVTVLGASRGVGGIDSWGTDVEEPYRLSGEKDYSVSFRFVL